MYLLRKKHPIAKHLWRDGDTVCRQASTGGLKLINYRLVNESPLPVCVMCQRKEEAYRGIKCN